MTMKHTLSLACVALAFMAQPLAAQTQQTLPPRIIAGLTTKAVLKERVVLTGENVTLGDLVENAGASASQVLFRAPALGQYGTIQAWRIIDAARSYGVQDVDHRGLEEVRVERLARTIQPAEMTDAIAGELVERMGSNDRNRLAVTLEGSIAAMQVDYSSTSPIAIEHLRHDPATGRFEATLIVPDSAHSRRAPLRVYGMAQEMVEMVRINRSLNRGDVITRQDLQIDRVARARAGSETPLTTAAIVGMVARRNMSEGTGLRASDLERARMVSRNDSVTLVYEIPGLTVTARGKALENGAIGDVVDILNLQSKRTLQATVIGHGKVAVQSSTPRRVASLNTTR